MEAWALLPLLVRLACLRGQPSLRVVCTSLCLGFVAVTNWGSLVPGQERGCVEADTVRCFMGLGNGQRGWSIPLSWALSEDLRWGRKGAVIGLDNNIAIN